MQRMIAEQLEMLPTLEMLDAQDEEDDYQGIGKGSRNEVPEAAEVINQHILMQNLRFLLIFHNGSTEEIDLDSLGIPLLGRYSRSKVLWTFQGRFRFYPRMKVDRALKNTRTTDVFISAQAAQQYITTTNFPYFMEMEARDVAREITVSGINFRTTANCFLYIMKLCRMGSDLIDYELVTHACNYWICDGIIDLQQGDVDTTDGVDGLWLSSAALQRSLRLDEDYYKTVSCLPSPAIRLWPDKIPYWTSPTFGIVLIPDPYGQIPKEMFQQFDKLCVLKLSSCQLSFRSPLFLRCQNIRFLWLNRCQHRNNNTGEVASVEDIRRFFQRLWVLDVRYSSEEFLTSLTMNFITQLREFNVIGVNSWDIRLLRGRLGDIRKLRARSLNDASNYSDQENLFSGKDKMNLLDFSGNNSLGRLSVESSCKSLETVIIEGSISLKEISLMGCFKLKNLFLSGSFPELYSIYITNAAVKILDLSAMIIPKLDSLSLLECGGLCAILWPPETEKEVTTVATVTRKSYLGMLWIDTTQKEVTTVAAEGNDSTAGRSPTEFNWNISVKNARILRSLEPIKNYFGSNHAHVKISTTINPYDHVAGCKDDGITSSSGQKVLVNLIRLEDNAIYADLLNTINNEHNCDVMPIMCMCPPPPDVPSQGCYIHIEDQMTVQLQGHASIALQGFICDGAKTLHIHDSLNITSILAAPLASETWNQLEWCRVEWCPKLGYVFNPQLDQEMFNKLRTVWVSHLPHARCIWKWSDDVPFLVIGNRSGTLSDLTIVHLDYCPKLIHIIHFPMSRGAFGKLETLDIMWCGDLSVAFDIFSQYVLDIILTQQWTFYKLKHIHLHELPMLRSICGIDGWIWAPELETINIRGCWSLRRLPIVQSQKVVECDCEKEWWDKLEWKSVEHASNYKPTHPRYYKKTMLRGSVLR